MTLILWWGRISRDKNSMKEPKKVSRNTSKGAYLDSGIMGGYKSNFAGRTGKNAPPELAPQRYVPKEKRNNAENKD